MPPTKIQLDCSKESTSLCCCIKCSIRPKSCPNMWPAAVYVMKDCEGRRSKNVFQGKSKYDNLRLFFSQKIKIPQCQTLRPDDSSSVIQNFRRWTSKSHHHHVHTVKCHILGQRRWAVCYFLRLFGQPRFVII